MCNTFFSQLQLHHLFLNYVPENVPTHGRKAIECVAKQILDLT